MAHSIYSYTKPIRGLAVQHASAKRTALDCVSLMEDFRTTLVSIHRLSAAHPVLATLNEQGRIPTGRIHRPRTSTCIIQVDVVVQVALERAELEDTSASEICGWLLQHYLALDEKPTQHGLPPEITTRKRSVYITKPTWAAARARKVWERRSISAILEQLLRAYLGLELGIEC